MLRLLLLLLIAAPVLAGESPADGNVCERPLRFSEIDGVSENYLARVIAMEVVPAMGCVLEPVKMIGASLRHQQMLQKGDLDMMAEASRTPERERHAWFSLPYRVERIVLIRSRNSERARQVLSIDDVLGRKLKIIDAGTNWLGPEVARLRPQWRSAGLMVAEDKPDVAMNALRDGRVDLAISSDEFFQSIRAEYPTLEMVLPPVYEAPVHFMFSKRSVSREQVDRFDEALRRWLARHPQGVESAQGAAPGQDTPARQDRQN